MNNDDLTGELAPSSSLTKSVARKDVDGVFSSVGGAAVEGVEVSMNSFGACIVWDSPARKVRMRPTDFGDRNCRAP